MTTIKADSETLRVGQGEFTIEMPGRYDKQIMPIGAVRLYAIGQPKSWIVGEAFVWNVRQYEGYWEATVRFSGVRRHKRRLTKADVIIRHERFAQ